MRHSSVIFLVLITLPVQTFSQVEFTKFVPNMSHQTCYTYNNDYAIAYNSGNNLSLIRLNQWGDLTWAKSYTCTNNYTLQSLKLTADSGFLLVGSDSSKSIIIKTDQNGNHIWTKNYQRPGGYLKLTNAHPLSNGMTYLTGVNSSGPSAMSEYFIVCINASGDTVFTKSFWLLYVYPDVPALSVVTSDNCLIIKQQGASRLIKFDTLGQVLWNNPINVGQGEEALAASTDGSIYWASVNFASEIINVIKYDSLANLVWSRGYKVSPPVELYHARIIANKYDQGYMIIGSTINNVYPLSPFLIQCDSSGNILNTILPYDTANNSMWTAIRPLFASQTSDSGFIVDIQVPYGSVFKKYSSGLISSCFSAPILCINTTPDYWGAYNAYTPDLSLVQISSDTVVVSSANYILETICSNIGTAPNVWPGDCNFDFEANIIDFLYLNVALNDTGITRTNASINWIAQPATNWSNFFSNGANHKHADCDGNGAIDLNDTTAVIQNYSLMHPYKPVQQVYQSGLPEFKFVANADSANAGDTISVAVYVDSLATSVDSLLGIAYSVLFDAALVDTAFIAVSYDSSALGLNHVEMESIRKNFFDNGKIDAAVCRMDHFNKINFSGLVGTIQFRINNNLPLLSQLVIAPSTVTGISQSGSLKYFNLFGDTIYIKDCNQPVQMILSDSILCYGDTLFCSALSNYPSQYEWSIDSVVYSNNAQFQTDTLHGGNHIISLVMTNGLCSYSFAQNIFVDQPMKPILSLAGNVLYSSISYNCQWYLNSQPIAGAVYDSLVVAQAGYYFVSITDSLGCIANSDSMFLNPLGINQQTLNKISIYPVSLNGNIYLNVHLTQTQFKTGRITIINSTGEIIKQFEVSNNPGFIPLGKIESGIYLCSAFIQGMICNLKFVVINH